VAELPRACAPNARLRELDLMRLVAALMVVAGHYLSTSTEHLRNSIAWGQVFDWGPLVGQMAQFGELGVDAFFIISGFVIALSAEGRTAREFLVSRAARIVPTFWFCCTLTWLLIALDPGYRQVSIAQLLANLFFVARPLGYEFVDGVYWSLVVEVRFYLLVAVWMWWRGSRGLTGFLFIWLVLAALDLFGLVPKPIRLIALPQYAPYFVCGAAIHLLGRQDKVVMAYGLLAGSLLLMCVKAGDRLPSLFAGQPIAIAGVYVGVALAIGLAATGRTAQLGRPWMSVAGAMTYPLYLIHQDLGYLVMRHVPALGGSGSDHRIGITVLTIALCVCLAQAIVYFVERPLTHLLRHRLRSAIQPRPSFQTGAVNG